MEFRLDHRSRVFASDSSDPLVYKWSQIGYWEEYFGRFKKPQAINPFCKELTLDKLQSEGKEIVTQTIENM